VHGSQCNERERQDRNRKQSSHEEPRRLRLEADVVSIDKVACGRDECEGRHDGCSAGIHEAPLGKEEFIGAALEEAGDDHVRHEKEATWGEERG